MTDNYDPTDPKLFFSDDGSPSVPADARVAKARLDMLNANDAVVDVLLDVNHPQHEARLLERQALQFVIGGQKQPKPSPEIERGRVFGQNIERAVHESVVAAHKRDTGK